jgi:hypothetical protein
MATINILLSALDEREIARRVAVPHDEARIQYRVSSNTVADFGQFKERIGHYYNYQFTTCVSGGGGLTLSESCGRAEELLENEMRRQQGTIVTAYNNAADGTNGGMRVVLDTICEGLKAEVTDRYIRDAFERHVAPNSWEQKVDIIRQFIAYAGPYLSSSIVAGQPERYAHNYSELIKSYTEGLRQTSSMFRRL